jgi:hypothetical protein
MRIVDKLFGVSKGTIQIIIENNGRAFDWGGMTTTHNHKPLSNSAIRIIAIAGVLNELIFALFEGYVIYALFDEAGWLFCIAHITVRTITLAVRFFTGSKKASDFAIFKRPEIILNEISQSKTKRKNTV